MMSTWDDKPNDYEHAIAEIEALQHDLDSYMKVANEYLNENERLRAENIKVSCHCADLIQELRNHGVSDERLKHIAALGEQGKSDAPLSQAVAEIRKALEQGNG
jgi:hypothetical protein